MLEPLVPSASAEVHLLVSPDCSVHEPFLCELIDGVDFFGLCVDRLCEPAAQPGDENSEVIRELFTFYQALVYCFFGLKTGDAETDEVKRVLPVRLDNLEELLGGVQLLSALLFGREAKLRQ